MLQEPPLGCWWQLHAPACIETGFSRSSGGQGQSQGTCDPQACSCKWSLQVELLCWQLILMDGIIKAERLAL